MAISKRGEKHQQLCKETPHFFKIISSPISQDLCIPTAFVKKFGDCLKNKEVVLKVPNGDSWTLHLRRTEDGIWFGEGWQQFAEYYAIENFYFLIFRYEGNCQFYVIICAPSASEIEYPIPWKLRKQNGPTSVKVRKLIQDEYDSVEILGERADSVEILRKRGERADSVKMLRKRAASDDDISVEILGVEQASPTQKIGRRARVKVKKENEKIEEDVDSGKGFGATSSPPPQCSCNCLTVANKEEYLSYQKAEAFTSKNSFFIRFIQPSYVKGPCYLSLPTRYLPKKRRCEMEFRVPRCQKVWRLKCTTARGKSVVTYGWKKFVQENNIVAGDACVIELVKDEVVDTPVFNVIIFRNK